MKRTTIVVFSCLHTREFDFSPPPEGQSVWCPKCAKYRHVAQSPHDYAVTCLSCHYAKGYGNAFVTAETAAVRHGVKRAGHRVQLTDGGELIREVFHPVIEVDVAVPPF